METYFENMAKLQNKDVLIVCDRGACDTFAYCSEAVKAAVLERENWTIDFLNHHRYDKIIHMVTAAKGARDFYGLDNEARHESAREGIDIDRKIQEVWFTNPRYVIIDNSDKSFQCKISRVFSEIGDLVTLPTEKFVRKFLLSRTFNEDFFPGDVFFAPYTESIVYLTSHQKKQISYLRKRDYVRSAKVIYTLKKRVISDKVEKRIETGQQISKQVYNEFLKQKDEKKRALFKECFYFRMEHDENVSIYKIETFLLKNNTFSVLHLTSNSQGKEYKIPDFLEVVREVTDEKPFFTYKLAKIKLGESK